MCSKPRGLLAAPPRLPPECLALHPAKGRQDQSLEPGSHRVAMAPSSSRPRSPLSRLHLSQFPHSPQGTLFSHFPSGRWRGG